ERRRLTHEIVWADEAFAAAQAFMVDEPAGLTDVFDAVDDLADDPQPTGAFRWGSTDLLRLRIGRYRVLYDVGSSSIEVIHLGRSD
ncbi:MAG: type II toxin-antitoxin system RelE family toxin, partial [Nocardioides sp.]